MKKTFPDQLFELARPLWSTAPRQQLTMPRSYRETVDWFPQIGDIFPDFHANTNDGPIRFFDWAEDHWTFVFGHGPAYTPVATSEFISFAAAESDFADRNVKLLGLSMSSLEDHRAWCDDVAADFGLRVQFPYVLDHTGKLLRAFGMLQHRNTAFAPVNKSFILDPQMRVRMVFDYATSVGRSTDEILRVIDALQAIGQQDIATPADWEHGDGFLFTGADDGSDSRAIHGGRLERLTPYITVLHRDLPALSSSEGIGPAENLTQLAYVSIHDGIRLDEARKIVAVSGSNNLRDGITGALVLGDDFFMQMLEGDDEKIGATLMRILKDPRHRDIQIITSGPAKRRLFSNWNMHLIEASKVRDSILSRYFNKDTLESADITERSMNALYAALANEDI